MPLSRVRSVDHEPEAANGAACFIADQDAWRADVGAVRHRGAHEGANDQADALNRLGEINDRAVGSRVVGHAVGGLDESGRFGTARDGAAGREIDDNAVVRIDHRDRVRGEVD